MVTPPRSRPAYASAARFHTTKTHRRHAHLDQSYVTFTFQKSGAPNLRTSRTLLRKAVGWSHSPHGTYVTSLRVTFWISSASRFRFVWSVSCTQSVTSFSSCGTSGQPNQARGPAPDTPKWTAGLTTSAPCHHV